MYHNIIIYIYNCIETCIITVSKFEANHLHILRKTSRGAHSWPTRPILSWWRRAVTTSGKLVPGEFSTETMEVSGAGAGEETTRTTFWGMFQHTFDDRRACLVEYAPADDVILCYDDVIIDIPI